MKYLKQTMGFLGVLALAGSALGSVNVDSAANYGGGWTNGANGGGGFGAWSITADSGAGWAGNGIWASSNAYLDMGAAFGFVAKGADAAITLDRAFTTALAAGDTFRLDLGLNYDAGAGGNKGFTLRAADNREIVTVNQAGSQTITVNGAAALTNYGVNTMIWTFTQLSATQVAVFATGRGGSETYVATVTTNTASHIANIRFYASAITNDEYAELRQVYFDNLTLTQGTSDTNLFRYSIEYNRAAITSVLASASGAIIVPATLGGYPVGAVGRAAFKDLTNITSISFAGGAGVTNFGPAAFQGCTALSLATLPSGLSALPAGLFQGCTGLVAVTIPSGVTNIGEAAFAECRALTGVVLPAGLAAVGESVFLNCRSLAALDVPAGMTSIPGQFCYECRSLTALDLPGGLTNIGYAAFYNCLGLTALALPASVTVLGQDAFRGCSGLTTLAMDAALAAVGDEAFFGCDNLREIYFYGGVNSLADGVFGACRSLAGVYFLCDVPTLDTGTDLFTATGDVTVYYIANPSSWGATLGGVPAVEWTPMPADVEVTENAFRFTVAWAKGQSIKVQACSDLTAPVWQDVDTYILTNGTCLVTDPHWADSALRIYRILKP